MSQQTPNEKANKPINAPEEDRADIQDPTEPRTDTDWDKWEDREQEWRRAGGDERAASETDKA